MKRTAADLPLPFRMNRFPHSLPAIATTALMLFAGLPQVALAAEDPASDLPAPVVFDDFNKAVAHAKEEDKVVFVACLLQGDPASFKLGELLKSNEIFLSAEKVAVFEYRVPDEERLKTFKTHFKVEGAGNPVVIIADSWGKSLASRTGFLGQKQYVEFVKKTAGEDAIEIPPEGVFGVKQGDLVGAVDLSGMRTWTTVRGQKFNAVLVEATGSKGVFRTDKDRDVEVGFNELSKEDIAFLEKIKVLKGGTSTTFPGTEGN